MYGSEIIQNQSHGKRADLWSLGCLLFVLLVGKPPFHDQSREKTLQRVCQNDFSIPSYLSSDARDLIEKLLQRDTLSRLSLEKVLQHPFLCNTLPQYLPEQCRQVAEKMNVLTGGTTTISSKYLSPIVHRTKYGCVSLEKNGNVMVEFDKTDEKFIIMKGGSTVS